MKRDKTRLVAIITVLIALVATPAMTFNNSIIAGETLVRTAVQSEGFVAGASGWRIERDGDAEFSNVTVRGRFESQNAFNDKVTIADGRIEFLFRNDVDPAIIESSGSATDDTALGISTQGTNMEQRIVWEPGQLTMLIEQTSPLKELAKFVLHGDGRALYNSNPIKAFGGKANLPSNSGITTTETAIGSITVQGLTAGNQVELLAAIDVRTLTANDLFTIRIREDSGIAGTALITTIQNCGGATNTLGFTIGPAFYTAPADEDKEFTITAQRFSGAGSITAGGSDSFLRADVIGS